MASSSDYVLGQSTHEHERLMLQARILRPYTEEFFRAAGITHGMSVLDLGSGMGDVALLAADIVGLGGRVLGLDRDGQALERARRRAVEQGCSSWVSFETTTFDDFSASAHFDAVVGRYVLLYQPDAAATLRRMLRFVKPGGLVVFHEMDFTCHHPTFPVCELYDQMIGLAEEAFRRAGLRWDFGRRLGPAFVDAGLPFPTIVANTPVVGADGIYLHALLANTIRSLAPRLGSLGLSLPAGIVADDTLADRLGEAASAARCQVMGPMQIGAWTRKPL